MTQSGIRAALAAATLCAFAAAQANAQSSPPQPTTPQSGKAAILILDASGSMWGQLDGGITKIEVAREVMGQFFATRDATIPLGVIAYGHNRRGDCSDIEIIARAGSQNPGALSQRLNRINPRGMTPISESLRIAAREIPPTAEEADIILVTDGLETCDADPCAVAAQLAQEGIKIRAHVVGFGLSEQQANALACVPDQTGGQLLRPQSGAELTDALNQIAAAEPMPQPEPEPTVQENFFDIGPKAEAGHTYRISYKGTARPVDYAGFTRRGEAEPDVSPSYGVIGGSGKTGNNPFTKQAPPEPGDYDLILSVAGQGVIARQAIEVVPSSNGFDPIGSVEPGKRFRFTWRGPDRVEQRVVIARPGDPAGTYEGDWGYALHKNGRMGLRAPAEPGLYELRYLSASRKEILFSRTFGVGVPYEDADLTTSAELAERALAATQAAPGQDALPMVPATFRLPDGFPPTPLSWSAVPLDPDMSPEAWAPQSDMVVGEGEFEPGRYEVSAVGPGETEFRGVVEIVPGQANDFVIPLVGGGEAEQNPPGQRGDAGSSGGSTLAQESQGMTCGAPSGCAYHDPVTGLALILPQGWEIDAPFFYETAGGAKARLPSASLSRTVGGELQQIMLNPRQWMAASGPCTDTPAGELCRATSTDVAYLGAFEVVRSSLRIATASAAPDASTVPRSTASAAGAGASAGTSAGAGTGSSRGGDIQPRNGRWTVTLGRTVVEGCPAMIAEQIRGAGLERRSGTREMTFSDPFHPGPLMADAPMQLGWSRTGPGSWQATLVGQSMGPTGRVDVRLELTVVSETELHEVNHFSMQLPAPLMAALGGGGSGACTSRTGATWTWQG